MSVNQIATYKSHEQHQQRHEINVLYKTQAHVAKQFPHWMRRTGSTCCEHVVEGAYCAYDNPHQDKTGNNAVIIKAVNTGVTNLNSAATAHCGTLRRGLSATSAEYKCLRELALDRSPTCCEHVGIDSCCKHEASYGHIWIAECPRLKDATKHPNYKSTHEGAISPLEKYGSYVCLDLCKFGCIRHSVQKKVGIVPTAGTKILGNRDAT